MTKSKRSWGTGILALVGVLGFWGWTAGGLGAAELPTVTIGVPDSSGAEWPTNDLLFQLTRTGDMGSPLTVNFRLAGTATWNWDYSVLRPNGTAVGGLTMTPGGLTGTWVIPAGSQGWSAATIRIRPHRDSRVEGWETVRVEILPGAGYTLGSSRMVRGGIKDWVY